MRAWRITAVVTLLLWAQGAVAGTLLVLGDSISAAFGLDTRQGWVSLLEQRLAAEGFDYQVVNASVSGDTSAGGLARLPTLLAEHRPDLLIVELGGNDGLRGQPPAQAGLRARHQHLQPLGPDALGDECRDIGHQVGKAEIDGREFHPAGLNLRNIKNIIHYFQ